MTLAYATGMWQIFKGSVGSAVVVSGGITQMGAGPMLTGSGKFAAQPRAVERSFDSLEVAGAASVEVTRADSCSLEVHGDDNLVDLLETEMRGSTLCVSFKRGTIFSSSLPLKVVATAPSVVHVELSGSGYVTLASLKQPELQVELNGSGDVIADGVVSSVSLTLNGSGDIDSRRLQARKAPIKLHGSGDIRALATGEAKVRLHGSGDVTVAGNPPSRDAKVSGSGDIDFR